MDTDFTIDSQNSEQSSFELHFSNDNNTTIAEPEGIILNIHDTNEGENNDEEQSHHTSDRNSDRDQSSISIMTNKWLGGIEAQSVKRTTEEIEAVGISVKKTERADLKKNDKKTYYKIRENCVEGIKNKFTQLKPIDENSPVEHFESIYSVVTRFDDLQDSLKKNDMIDVFTIASIYEGDGTGPTATAVEIDLFRSVNDTGLDLIKSGSQFFMEYGADFHGENIVWSGEKILNSCDETLRDKLIESTRGWDVTHKGGPTFLKLLMRLIVATSEKSLRSLLDKVAKLKLSDFNGEDVRKAVSFIRGAVLILKDNKALPSDFLILVLRTFRQTTCTNFSTFVGLLEHNVELKMTALSLEDILQLFEKKYTDMLGRGEWTPKSVTKDQASGFSGHAANYTGSKSIICFNCGGLDHIVSECKMPIDKRAISIRKGIILGTGEGTGVGNNKYQRPKGNSGAGPGNGKGDRDSKPPPNPLLVPPKRSESHEKVFDGKKLYWCGKPGCCKWGDHKTVDHPEPDNDANPQGNLADDSSQPGSTDVGDDSTSETGGYAAGAAHFLTSTSLNF